MKTAEGAKGEGNLKRKWKRKGRWLEFEYEGEAGTVPESPPLDMSPKLWRALLRQGGVSVSRGRLSLLLYDDEAPQFEPSWTMPEILYEDDLCLVANKPPGIPVHPAYPEQTDTLANRMAGYLIAAGEPTRVRHIHRLDEQTSGPVLYAKNDWAQSWWDARLRDKEVDRRYVAVVAGVPRPPQGTWDAPIGRDRHRPERRRVSPGGDPALTRYRVLERYPASGASLIELKLETGRTHQIRVHASHAGHPILGDVLYGGSADLIRRQALHGISLVFPHPFEGEIAVEAPIPDDIGRLLQVLRGREARR